jgi:tetratricopeptide (TPR) repeat protein
MNNSFDYIDDYFSALLSDEEKKVFEQRCLSDNAFAEEVAAYISLRDGLKDQLNQQKKDEFTELYHQLSADQKKVRRINLRPLAYLAAASVLLFIGWFLFFREPGPKKLADQYAAANLNTLGLNMGSSDNLQAGITAYNAKQYAQAEDLFQSASERQRSDFKAIEYLGLTHLAMKHYEQALKDFDRLSAMSLYSNPGLFYKALTLMERSEGTDLENAKKILQEVINKNLYGNKEARTWITKL